MNKLNKLIHHLQVKGLALACGAVYRRLFNPADRLYHETKHMFHGKVALEIGHRSWLFNTQFPIYRQLAGVDNLVTAGEEFWNGIIDRRLKDACAGTVVRSPGDSGYSCLLASHVLEHVGNPLRTLQDWHKLLGPYGLAVIVVPWKDYIPDRLRPVTSFSHLMEDYRNWTDDNDTTHYEEFVHGYDFGMNLCSWPKDESELIRLTLDNFNSCYVHHHVFDELLLRRCLGFAKFTILYLKHIHPCHIVAICRRSYYL